ncbi:MAG: flippase [bacterium]|nr:flippase [bacterium]
MSTLSRVTSNTAWQIGSKIGNSVSGLIIIALITRHFGDQGVGIYTLVLGYLGFFFMPVDFGLNAIAVKHLLDQKRSAQKVFGNLLGLRLTIGALVMLLALIIIWVLPYDPASNTGYSNLVKIGVTVQILTILAQALLATTNAFFQARHNYKYSFYANLCSAVFNTGLVCLLILNGFPLIYTLAAFSISGIVGATTALLLVKKQLKQISVLTDKNYWKEMLTETLPLTISLILNLVYFRIDSLILPFYRQLEEVGHYNVAYKIFDTLLVLPNYFANSIYPVLLERYAQSIDAFTKIIKKSVLTLTILALAGTAATYILAPLAVQILLSHPNPETIQYLRILSSGLIFFFLSSIATWSLIIINKQKYLSYIYGGTMIINITLNILLIPLYGALASAYITIATEALVLILTGTLVFINLTTGKAHNDH